MALSPLRGRRSVRSLANVGLPVVARGKRQKTLGVEALVHGADIVAGRVEREAGERAESDRRGAPEGGDRGGFSTVLRVDVAEGGLQRRVESLGDIRNAKRSGKRNARACPQASAKRKTLMPELSVVSAP